ncbi:MAG: 50S ribosomal protein L20 [Nitrospiraceae bacterium]|nr:50S ribosomal protein L20 [Nitrospiraceae bacterium]
MPRAKGGFKTRRRRKKVLEAAKGFYGGRSRLFRVATEAVDTALGHAFAHRKTKKRDFRALWIARINAAARQNGISYSQLMSGMKKADISLNRKVLADMAATNPETFEKLVQTVRQKLAS